MAESKSYRGEGGAVIRFDLPLAEQYAEQVRKGRLVEVPDAADAVSGAPAATPAAAVDPAPPDEPADSADRPGRAHPKADWVAYAIQVSDLTEAEADELTKAELISRFGG